MGIPKPNEHDMYEKLIFPTGPGEKTNFNGMVHCVNENAEKKQCDGICCNCQYHTVCVWKEDNKIFCEHYQ